MDLDDATLRDLAAFLARRYPTPQARAELAGAAGLSVHGVPEDAVNGWFVLLQRAMQARKLRRLLDVIHNGAPNDSNLAEVRRLLTARPSLHPLWVGAGLLGGIAVVLIGLWAAFSGPSDSAPASEAPAPEAPAPEAPAPTEVPDATPESPASPAPAPPAPAPPAPAPAAPAPEPPTPAPAAPAPTALRVPDSIPRQCRGTPGVQVGWWYAGEKSPGKAGDIITLASSVNVRTDYPRKENRYSMRGKVLCSPQAGTRQRLSANPVDVGGGNWWVPVWGGDWGE